jgi:hypothetical protein
MSQSQILQGVAMPPSTQIDFAIRGKRLQLDQITNLLRITPTGGFNPNEPYIGRVKEGNAVVKIERRRPSFGVWHFCTEGLVSSESLEDHAQYLLTVLESAKVGIDELRHSQDYTAVLTMWHVGPAGFDIASETMSRLAALSSRIYITCFEVPEEPEQAQPNGS